MNIPLFKKLCEATGAPAFEYEIRQIIIDEMAPLADDVWVDNVGAVIALILNFCKISPLAFALGMFIPLQLNLPLIVGGLVNWYVSKPKTAGAGPNTEASDKGTLLASGFIAGGALMGVVSAALRFAGCDFVCTEWLSSTWAETLSLVAYILLIIYFIKASKR